MFAGFLEGYCQLDDRPRWDIYTYILSQATPPPHKSVLRCDRHAGFTIHFAEPWLDVVPVADGVTVVTAKAQYRVDAAILATGFSVDLPQRPELARIHDKVLLWADRVGPRRPRDIPIPPASPISAPASNFSSARQAWRQASRTSTASMPVPP